MNKFIVLTNNVGPHKGDPILINSGYIVTALDLPSDNGYITKVFTAMNVEYEVEESARTIYKMIEGK